MHLRILLFTVVALASIVPAARAADIASARRKDGTTIILTDGMLPECNRLNFHGAARMQRGKTVQQACWTFDWKKRVFSVMPLTPRKTGKNPISSIAEALGVEREAAWIAQQLRGDSANKISLPADAFTWYDKRSPARSGAVAQQSNGLSRPGTPFAWSQEMHRLRHRLPRQ